MGSMRNFFVLFFFFIAIGMSNERRQRARKIRLTYGFALVHDANETCQGGPVHPNVEKKNPK